jgi:hypothetical protein
MGTAFICARDKSACAGSSICLPELIMKTASLLLHPLTITGGQRYLKCFYLNLHSRHLTWTEHENDEEVLQKNKPSITITVTTVTKISVVLYDWKCTH